MSFKEQIEKLVEQLLDPILVQNNYELVDVEYVKEVGTWYLRIYIDKEGGVTVDDCEVVSRALDVELDKTDPIKDPYILEVSSPGLSRPLKKDKDFTRSIGKAIEIKLYKAMKNEREFVGILESFDSDQVVISIEKEGNMTFNRKDIALIRLAVIF
ncbi:MAG: ribosome maturation factor RimP [Firmicutes bacterium HGW-Firmicutes-1]|nr:MAG: ribosome maturation factor RimP [Firmicutes bacterium HGW-Firmicutes-1]